MKATSLRNKMRCILLARSSKDSHDVSCESQLDELRDAAERAGDVVVRSLSFPAVRHTDFLEDPDFLDLLDEAKQKDRNWNKLWLYDTSRLSRNRLKAQTTKAFLRRHGVLLEFLKVPSTGEEHLDNVIEGILETFDQLHSDFSRAGAIRGQRQNVRRGFRAGGSAPFGYRLLRHALGKNAANEDIQKSTLEPDPETFPVVCEYLTRGAAGEPRAAILREFERRGIPNPSGKPHWNPTTGTTIERNLVLYQGHLVYNRHNRRIDGSYVGGRKYRPREEWEIRENCHSAAITAEQARTIDLQNEPRRRLDGVPRARTYLLTGFLRCGSCGGPMVGDRGLYVCSRSRRGHEKCGNSGISSSRIDEHVLGHFRDVLLSTTHFEAVLEATRAAYADEIRKSS